MFVPEEGSLDGREVGVPDVRGAAVPARHRPQLRPVVPEGVPGDGGDGQRRARVEDVGPGPAPEPARRVQRRTYNPAVWTTLATLVLRHNKADRKRSVQHDSQVHSYGLMAEMISDRES